VSRARHRQARARHRLATRDERMPRRVVTAALVAGALVVPIAVSPSAASWADAEWVRADAAALDCTSPEVGTARGEGRLLGGTLLGLDLDTVAEVWGVSAASDGLATTPTPADAVEVPGSGFTAFQDPLAVEALSAITLPLGDLLRLPLDTDTGVYNQYARADDDATSAGASGLVTDSGGIDLGPIQAPEEERPEFGTIHLGSLLEAALGEGLSDIVAGGVADLELGVGAVSGAAVLDGCTAGWTDDVYSSLSREYAIAGVDLAVETPLVGGLVSAVDGVLGGVEDSVAALAGDEGVVTGILGGVVGALSGALGALGVAGPSLDLALTVDLSAARGLLTDTIGDDAGIVAIDFDGGWIGIDLAALLGEAYGSDGLNGLAPNTELLVDTPVLAALVDAITDAVAGLVDDLVLAVERALDLVHVKATVHLPLLGSSLVDNVALGVLDLTVDASLASLLDGTATVSVKMNQAVGLCAILIIGTLACGLVNLLLLALTDVVLRGVVMAIGGVLDAALTTLGAGLKPLLDAALEAPVAAILTLLDATLSGLLGPDGVLSLTVNAQNDPDPADAAASPELSSWAGILGTPSWSSGGFSTGRYDVAALVLRVLGALDAVELVLARGSVGGNVVG